MDERGAAENVNYGIKSSYRRSLRESVPEGSAKLAGQIKELSGEIASCIAWPADAFRSAHCECRV